MIDAKEGLTYDSDSPGLLIVRAPSAVGIRFTVKGLEAHAGVAPERGISAIQVAANAIAAMRLGRIDEETTANLGVIKGGRAGNIIPGEATVRGEVRSRNAAKLQSASRSHGRVLQGRGCESDADAGRKALRGDARTQRVTELRGDECSRRRAAGETRDRSGAAGGPRYSSPRAPAAVATPTFSIVAAWSW